MSVTLFVTTLSLSPRTAIGIQTKLFMDIIPDSKHLFWDPHDIGPFDRRSRRAESRLFSWVTRLRQELKARPAWDKTMRQPHRKTVLSRTVRIPRMGFSWWEHNRLKPTFGKALQKLYKKDISVLYLAPMSSDDSERMRSLLHYLEKPFVVHLWDILNPDQIENASFQWLLAHASHVFCLSSPMIEYIRPFQTSASILSFARNPSSHRAKPRVSGPLRIALIGICYKYRDGLSLLEEAVAIVQKQGIDVEIIYVGPRKNIEGWSFSLSKNLHVTGFMSSDDSRDHALAECHIGFLPGPLASPDENMYSRFSIPSRILDYMAVGLPLIATVHPQSATAGYIKNMQMEASITNTVEHLAQKLEMLARPSLWTEESVASMAAFQVAQQEQRGLEYWLMRSAATENRQLSEASQVKVPTETIQHIPTPEL